MLPSTVIVTLARLPLGQPEIHDVRLAGAVHHHVARLQVAMDDALRVGVVEGQGDLAAQFGRLP